MHTTVLPGPGLSGLGPVWKVLQIPLGVSFPRWQRCLGERLLPWDGIRIRPGHMFSLVSLKDIPDPSTCSNYFSLTQIDKATFARGLLYAFAIVTQMVKLLVC